MSGRNLIAGLTPEYNYPGSLEQWMKNNTQYASNLGACFITNALLRQFDADFAWDLSDPQGYSRNYDACILSLATHLHPRRDISPITQFVEQLTIPTYFVSGGISDYETDISSPGLHPSVRRLLEIASADSAWIGVRGNYSAHYLERLGFNNVVPIGCPTMYWNCQPELRIASNPEPADLLIPYHFTLAIQVPQFLEGKTLLGQDYQDQVIFTDDLQSDTTLAQWLEGRFPDKEAYSRMCRTVAAGGVFHNRFEDWFRCIGRHDFLLGPRLHGCLAALVQGIPAILAPRDKRVREIVEFYRLPHCDFVDLIERPIEEICRNADFSKFEEVYQHRYRNYCALLKNNGISSRHTAVEQDYEFSTHDRIVRHGLWLADRSAPSRRTDSHSPEDLQKDDGPRTSLRTRLRHQVSRAASRITRRSSDPNRTRSDHDSDASARAFRPVRLAHNESVTPDHYIRCAQRAEELGQWQLAHALAASARSLGATESQISALSGSAMRNLPDPGTTDHEEHSRCVALSAAIQETCKSPQPSVLHFGGDDGLLARYLPEFGYCLADPVWYEDDAANIPFHDRSFDIVAAHRVLQSIPSEQHPAFLDSLMRCARSAVVLFGSFGVPNDSPDKLRSAIREFQQPRRTSTAAPPSLESLRDHAVDRGWAYHVVATGSAASTAAFSLLRQYAFKAGCDDELQAIDAAFNQVPPTSLDCPACPDAWIVTLKSNSVSMSSEE